MSDPRNPGLDGPIQEGWKTPGPEPQNRAVGSPLPIGSGSSATAPPSMGEPPRGFTPPPPPGRALMTPALPGPFEVPSGVQKAVSALRAALPWVQRILPLLDGNIGTAVSNMLTPHQHTQPQHPPAPPVNLAPIEESLGQLQAQQRDMRTQLLDQNSSLKRVEDHLEMVREATDRNTLEQQELMEDLKSVGNKVNLFAFIALGLLGISVLVNVVLYLHILRVLP